MKAKKELELALLASSIRTALYFVIDARYKRGDTMRCMKQKLANMSDAELSSGFFASIICKK